MNFLFTQYQERTIFALLLTAIIGGFVGASLKLIFEVILAGNYTQNRNAKMIINKYSNPIIRSADSLRGRLANLLTTNSTNWHHDTEYYRVSTYYVFCSYFAWIHILFRNLLKFKYTTSRKNRKLNKILISVEKAFNNRDYFTLKENFSKGSPLLGLPKYIYEGLGELNVKKEDQEDTCLDYIEFYNKYQNDKFFREWVENLDYFLRGIKNEYGNAKWDRIHIIELSLVALNNFLDPHHEQSRKYSSKITKNIFQKINNLGAREIFARDIVWNSLPIIVEPLIKRIHRKVNIKLKGSGILLNLKDKTEFQSDFWEVRIPKNKFKLEDKNDRRLMYEYIEKEIKNRSQNIYFGGNFKVILTYPLENLKDGVVNRITRNILRVTQGRVKVEDVFWKSKGT